MFRRFEPKKLVVVFACMAMLSACVAPTAGSPQRQSVAGGQITAAVPAGFCFVPEATLDTDDGAVLIARKCQASDRAPAVLTLSIGASGSSEALKAGAKALSDWFLSSAGRAALARDGRAGSVRIVQVAVVDGVVLLHLTDRNVGDYWRAVLGLRSRLVTVSVAGPEGTPLDPALSRKLVEQTVSAIKKANPATKS